MKKIPLYKETGAIRKEWGGRVPVAIVYPNSYYVGMSSLATHQLYRLFNAHPRIAAERIFLSDKISSIESSKALADFKVAAFTFSFEADYLNIPKIVGRNIPLRRIDRDSSHPLLIAGGAAVTMNPEAQTEIFDLIMAGEIEEISAEMSEIIAEGGNKDSLISKLSKLRGITAAGEKIKPAIYTTDLNIYPTHSVIWSNDTEFGHMHLVEVSRGCPWRCAFCATPGIYGPFRKRSKKAIIKSIEYGLPYRKQIGLIGSDVLAHEDFMEIAKDLSGKGIKVSPSSMRVNRITKEMAVVLKNAGIRRATLGIEAGSERLRKKIDKDLSDSAIFKAVKNLAGSGITNFKLYFMIGLPDEKESDIEDIPRLIKEIRQIILEERELKTLSPDIAVVITPFIPKKLTKFASEQFAGVQYLKNCIKTLKLSIGGIPNSKMNGETAKHAELEYKLSSADKKSLLKLVEYWNLFHNSP